MSKLKLYFFIIFGLLTPASQAVVGMQLKDSVQLSKRVALIGDIATVNCDIESDCIMLRNIPVISFPRVGSKLVVSQQAVNRLIQQYDRRVFSRLAWHGSEKVTITSATQLLSLDELVEKGKLLLIQRFANDQVAASYVGGNDQIQIPTGDVTYRQARITGSGVSSKMFTSFDVFVDGQYARTVSLGFNVSILRTGWVSQQEIPAHIPVPCLLFRQQTVDMTNTPDMVVSCDESIQLKQTLMPGKVLRRSHLYIPPAVSQGSSVILSIHTGGITLETEAIALADGQIGQIIQVKPAHGTAPVNGKVIRPGVLIAMGAQWKN
ncbi:flagella basal body P-ring formation protein FlgA [Chitinivorax tropicus]|uniref:Flagella basal body P-ring formation protein FlgA n=1 Tax=Chitinivorax tropicus TaxID=714531 RepID=A0A840MVF0_9PROT|nr:flagellar basal body P-ring formation chaperone FlgA [Chitinivorax tropicus]MBB5020313.1 flagella basal body P-ring formation protein FlgA [Chitinivorax tropicus]